MTTAVWKGVCIADSGQCETVDGNRYFPAGAVDTAYLRASDTTTVCPWKGTASYYDVVVDGDINKDAAWYYPETSQAAANIRGYIAFWRGVVVQD